MAFSFRGHPQLSYISKRQILFILRGTRGQEAHFYILQFCFSRATFSFLEGSKYSIMAIKSEDSEMLLDTKKTV